MKKRNCLHCNTGLKNGRTDKKFCDDHCRNSYNNERTGAKNNFMRNVSNALRRNRNILERFAEQETISRDELLDSGFKFDFITGQKKEKNTTTFYCFDFGYKFSEGFFIEIVSPSLQGKQAA